MKKTQKASQLSNSSNSMDLQKNHTVMLNYMQTTKKNGPGQNG